MEVIRAAYRVLAAKYHPDRQASAGEGSDDAAHAANAEMAALNTAYQVLVHPDRRREYDGLLAEKRALHKITCSGQKARLRSSSPNPSTPELTWNGCPQSRPKKSNPGTVRAGPCSWGSLVGVVLVGGAFWISHLVVQHQMEKPCRNNMRPVRPMCCRLTQFSRLCRYACPG